MKCNLDAGWCFAARQTREKTVQDAGRWQNTDTPSTIRKATPAKRSFRGGAPFYFFREGQESLDGAREMERSIGCKSFGQSAANKASSFHPVHGLRCPFWNPQEVQESMDTRRRDKQLLRAKSGDFGVTIVKTYPFFLTKLKLGARLWPF